MPIIEVNKQQIELDNEGFLLDQQQWSKNIASAIAKREKIDLSDYHWTVINFLRNYYQQYDMSPLMRVLSKNMKEKLGPEYGSSSYLYKIFPLGPLRQGAKIAGLPKPPVCF